MSLERANKARYAKALIKKYRFSDYGIASFKDLIDRGVFSSSEISTVPKYKYNRLKYNRMNHEEQKAYEEKLKQTKKQYSLIYKDSEYSTDVPKCVYDYFNQQK